MWRKAFGASARASFGQRTHSNELLDATANPVCKLPMLALIGTKIPTRKEDSEPQQRRSAHVIILYGDRLGAIAR